MPVCVCESGLLGEYIISKWLYSSVLMRIVFWQNPFNKLFYEIIGDDNAATYFKINSQTGDITVNRDLKQTNTEVFTVSVPVYCATILPVWLCHSQIECGRGGGGEFSKGQPAWIYKPHTLAQRQHEGYCMILMVISCFSLQGDRKFSRKLLTQDTRISHCNYMHKIVGNFAWLHSVQVNIIIEDDVVSHP